VKGNSNGDCTHIAKVFLCKLNRKKKKKGQTEKRDVSASLEHPLMMILWAGTAS